MIGAAGALLVFTGVWHALEWAMGGRNRDTARLVPVGLIYAALGYSIVTLRFMPHVAWVALALVLLGMIGAVSIRKTSRVRGWVIWAFILVDALIAAALAAGLLA